MTRFDPPSDPYGDERSCRICDGELTYNYLIREWECLADHDATEVVTASVDRSLADDILQKLFLYIPSTQDQFDKFESAIRELLDERNV